MRANRCYWANYSLNGCARAIATARHSTNKTTLERYIRREAEKARAQGGTCEWYVYYNAGDESNVQIVYVARGGMYPNGARWRGVQDLGFMAVCKGKK